MKTDTSGSRCIWFLWVANNLLDINIYPVSLFLFGASNLRTAHFWTWDWAASLKLKASSLWAALFELFWPALTSWVFYNLILLSASIFKLLACSSAPPSFRFLLFIISMTVIPHLWAIGLLQPLYFPTIYYQYDCKLVSFSFWPSPTTLFSYYWLEL